MKKLFIYTVLLILPFSLAVAAETDNQQNMQGQDQQTMQGQDQQNMQGQDQQNMQGQAQPNPQEQGQPNPQEQGQPNMQGQAQPNPQQGQPNPQNPNIEQDMTSSTNNGQKSDMPEAGKPSDMETPNEDTQVSEQDPK